MRKLSLIVVSMLGLIGVANAQDGLVGHWTLNEGNGQIAGDSSGNGNNGQLGSTAGADNNDPTWTTGIYGTTGLHFDPTTINYVKVPQSASLEPQNITVEAWVRHSGPPPIWAYIAAKGVSTCASTSYALFVGASRGLMFYIANNSFYQAFSPDAGQGVWDGKWHHVAGTYDGSRVRLFVDGSEIGTGTPSTLQIGYNMVTHNDFYIGANLATCYQGGAFNGDIDDVGIWNRALTAYEIAQRRTQ